MQKATAVLGSALFFVVAPCVLAGLIPWGMTRWEFGPALFGLEVTRAIGVLFILIGLPGLVDSFVRFALQGLGTPAPVAPTQNLVVTGLYRYVRNPIYVAVVAIILGQGMLFGDCVWWSTARSYGWPSICSSSPTKSQRWSKRSAHSTTPIAPTFRGGSRASLRGEHRKTAARAGWGG